MSLEKVNIEAFSNSEEKRSEEDRAAKMSITLKFKNQMESKQ